MFCLGLSFWASWPLKMQWLLLFLILLLKGCLIEFVFMLVLAAFLAPMLWR